MRKQEKRILSFMMCIFMILGMAAGVYAEETDVFDVISTGIASSQNYIQAELNAAHEDGGVTYGYEWYIIALLRAGKDIEQDILDEYYDSVVSTIQIWDEETKPTDIERVALTLTLMDIDITDINGINLAEMIYNNEKLADGSNELVYALLALDAANVEIPDTATWSREEIVSQIMSYQLADGSFGLEDAETGDIDMTAMCLQSLAPYASDTMEITENALAFLKDAISTEYRYADNSNTTAQVLLTLSVYGVDVTDLDNGFGDATDNIITALDGYRNPDGYGYLYNGEINSLATVQVMQAYDAYRKMQKENVSYWDFSVVGDVYDDFVSGDDSQPEVEKAEPANVYVTIASEGIVVATKDDGYMAQAEVTVVDLDENGTLTVDEALYAAHEAYYDGGAEAGYSSFSGIYGLSLAKLWGKGIAETSLAAGYWLNNASCWSLEDAVSEGDYITAFNYYDAISWGDAYSCFTKNSESVRKGKPLTLELKYLSGYDAENNYASMFSACADADITILGYDNLQGIKTGADGKATLEFSAAGEYYVMASKVDGSIVPAVCKIEVTVAPVVSFGGWGGSGGSPVSAHTVKFETNGGSVIESQKINKNDCVIKPESPVKDGFVFDGWYLDKEFEEIYNFDTQVEKSFTLYAKWIEEKETVTFDDDIYADVKAEDWYYDAVKHAYENNIMYGTGDVFEPDAMMTREMLVTVLWRMEGKPAVNDNISFNDVADGEWYTDAVSWASVEGIVLGKDDFTFGTGEEITREQTATILYRFAEKKGFDITDEEINIDIFNDAEKISEYAISALKWAVKSGIMNGKTNDTLSPTEYSTRAEIATMLMRFCKVIK